ncbi:fused nickel transport protein NikMN [bacterium BMS3Abin07]|nr:fused nickel transport protein NikMN [bacterium BMS3Abin07]GBE32535.1 fused nickel transport protein NikMN [bacterium BMS3Bbin05]HDL20587.1 cobalamin biosynthesis protein [Nitrospirota bacterium]HDO22534.1 cobalamin biosynthesis protein [Nitrospirota bacterium]HDZ88357.1 cobalamin biosynthesis protein [Nitrospirota bacterium]
MTKSQKKLWTGLFILAVLTPLGIILPEIFKAGDAWGEWGPDKLEKLLGYMPEGLKRLAALWKAPVPGYNFSGEGASTAVQVISYIASGLIGILAVGVLIYLISRLIVNNEK